jgi:hypothetical protein
MEHFFVPYRDYRTLFCSIHDYGTLFSRERSSTGSNDCFVVVVVVVVLVVFYPLVI